MDPTGDGWPAVCIKVHRSHFPLALKYVVKAVSTDTACGGHILGGTE